MPITALPEAPSRSDPANFASKADALVAALPTFVTEANALQASVNAAAAAAQSAAQTVNVAGWVSGTTYSVGQCVYDTTDFLTYRRKTAGAGTTRPGLDTTSWQLLTGFGDVTQTGTQTLTNKSFGNNPTLSAGTSNGISYLNASKQLVSGTSIQFDGSILTVGKTSPAFTGSSGCSIGPSNSGFEGGDAVPVIQINRTGSNNNTAIEFFRNYPTNVNPSGSISVTTTSTSYNTSSDYRLKNNIRPIENAIQKVLRLRPCTYTWRSDGSSSDGFIAHELQEVIPDCVTGEKDAVDEDGNPIYQGIDTSFLVSTLTAAIQEQQAIIEQLKSRLDALEASTGASHA